MKQARGDKTMIALVTLLLYILSGIALVGGFQGGRHRFAFGAVFSRGHQLQATIFYPSWEDEDTSSDLTEATTTDSTLSSSSEIPEFLSDQAWTAPLARLAAGYCRPGGLKIEKIEQVAVRAVEASQIDIEAIVCEQEGCVSLSVPVIFQDPCDPENNFADCVLKNIEALDQAQSNSVNNRVVMTEAEIAAAEALQCTATVEYPDWWSPPGHIDLSKQCDALLHILNEADFQSDLVALARTEWFKFENVTVRQAAAVAVGPAGLILRAVSFDGDMVELPIAFLESAADADSLREAVLDCVEGVTP